MLPNANSPTELQEKKLNLMKLHLLHILCDEKYLPYSIPLIQGYLGIYQYSYSSSYIEQNIEELIGMGFVVKQIIGLARKPKAEKRNECIVDGKRSKKNIIMITKAGKEAYEKQLYKYQYLNGPLFFHYDITPLEPNFPLYENYKEYPKSDSHMALEERDLIEKESTIFAYMVEFDQAFSNRSPIKYICSRDLKAQFKNKSAKASRMVGAFILTKYDGQEEPYLIPVYNSGNFIHAYQKDVELKMQNELRAIYHGIQMEEEILLGDSTFVLERYCFALLDRKKKQSSSNPKRKVSIKKRIHITSSHKISRKNISYL